jgi:hypothetical protein
VEMPRLFVVCALVVLAGCTIDPQEGSTQASASPPAPVTCQAGADCDAKWSRAIEWIKKNSAWKIQRQTDVLIQTYNSINDSSSPGFKVTKVAASQPGTYEMDFTGKCSNMWGCTPTVAAARAHFADFVTGDVPAQTAPSQTAPVPTTPAQIMPARITPAQTTPAQTTPAQATPAQATPIETTPVETPMAWFRKDQQQVSGNPALENQIQFDRTQCQAAASKNGQPGGPDFESAFKSCMDVRGYTLDPPGQANQEADQASQEAH